MAKAIKETTTWILLRDARALVIGVYQAPRLAERLLVRWLEAGQMRWRCLGMEGSKRSSDPNPGAPEFWQMELATPLTKGRRQIIKVLHVNWDESSACRKVSPVHGYTAFRIEVPREDILKVLPTAIAEPVAADSPTATWIIATVRRKKAAGEIPDGIRKTSFSRLIEDWMRKAVRAGDSVRPVGWQHIKNNLPAWGLWPLSSIK